MVRPKISNPKNKFITVRLTEKELAYVSQNATCACLTMSEFSRRCILGRQIHFVAHCDREAVDGLFSAIGEMKKVGGLLKHSIELSHGNLKGSDVSEILSQLNETIKIIGDTAQKIPL